MKKARKLALFLAAALIFTIIPSNIVSALEIGDEIGDVLNTDIKTFIDGKRIPSYNINGKSAVLIKDLKNYGFDSFYDNIERTSTVKFNPNKKFTPMTDFDEQTGKIGTLAFKYVYTDIIAMINGEKVESFNIKGNLAIFFTDLRDFGKMVWDAEKRESRLTLSTPVSGISLNRTSASISVDEIIHLTPTIAPADATDKNVTWTSSNENVALVVNGRVVGLAAGTATITAASSNGKTASCTVTVTSTVLVSSLSFDITSATVKANESIVLNPYFYPANATDKTLKWTSSNTNVARVDTYGRVTGTASGTATITATTSNGKTAKCTVTVTVANPVTSISINTSSTTIVIGEYADLSATIRPSNATDKTVTWYSSNTNVVRVDNYGRITGIASGYATITAESSNGLTAKCTITVSDNYVTSVSLDRKSITLQPGNSTTLYATTYPTNVSSSYLTWTSSNPNVVTVDNYGYVTAVNNYDSYYGNTATITVTGYSSNGYTVSDSCTVTVGSTVTASVYASSNSISAGGSVTFTADYWPYNSSYYITWNFYGATDSSGSGSSITVTAAAGASSITATATVYSYANGNYLAQSSRTITVSGTTTSVTGVTLSAPSISIPITASIPLTATVSPSNATNKSVTWSSSDTSIATVSNGVVTAKAAGTTTITVTTSDGAFTDTCVVTVY